jgi:indolepyruvate ferredoxin oxidoreductase
MASVAAQPPDELASHLLRRTAQVIDYQNVALGRRFLDLVLRAAGRDDRERDWALTRAVAESWFRLLTYKDEYEVARLHGATRYDLIARDLGIEGQYALRYHLHPPFLRRLGLQHKLALGWLYALAFMLLRALKPLRGTIFDVFGWDRDRRLERAVIREYQQLVEQKVLAGDSAPYAAKLELAASALTIKGYGPIKERAIAAWRVRTRELESVTTEAGE